MAWGLMDAQRFFDRLSRQVPEFSGQIRGHLEDEGELLPVVLMDEFSRFVIDRFSRSISNDPEDASCRDVFERSVSFLNDEYRSSGEDVRLLINTTFSETLESLWRNKVVFVGVYETLCPELRATVNVAE